MKSSIDWISLINFASFKVSPYKSFGCVRLATFNVQTPDLGQLSFVDCEDVMSQFYSCSVFALKDQLSSNLPLTLSGWVL